MTDDHIGTGTGSVDVGSAATRRAADGRAASFLDALGRAKQLLTTRQYLASVEIRIVEHALVRFRSALADGPGGPDVLTACRHVGRGLDRIAPTLDEILKTPGRAERRRLVERLSQLAKEQQMVSAIGRVVEPTARAAAFRASLAASAEHDILLEAGAALDQSVERVEEVLRQNRRGEERRQQAFDQFMRDKSAEVERVAEDTTAHLTRASARFEELTHSAKDLITKIELVSTEASLARLNKDRRVDEDKEEREFRRYRRLGILWATTGPVLLLGLAIWLPPQSIAVWFAHLVPAAFIASISTYCVRNAARHRGEAIALRSDRLEMDIAVLSVAGGFSDAEVRSLKECRDRLAAERARFGGFRTGENDSISLSLPRTVRSMLSSTPKPGPDGRQ